MGKLGEGSEFKYESIIPQAPTDMKFHYWEELEDGTKVLRIHTENFKLITDIEELKTYIELCKDKIMAFDTETTGLTYGEDKIVGFSFSLDKWSGVYVPIRHKIRHEVSEMVDKLDENGNQVLTKAGRVSRTKKVIVSYTDYEHNIDPKEALDVLYEILTGAKRVLMHNSEFDLNMLKFEGYNVNRIRSFDNLILPYLYDPEATGMAGLKALEQRVLGRTVPEFKDVLGKKCSNFAEVNPEDGYVYAVCDVCGLIGVYQKMFPMVRDLLKKFKKPLVIDGEEYNVMIKDNQMVKMFVDYYGHANILIDREKALEYKKSLKEEQRKVTQEVYDYFEVGIFNLARSKEFAQVMASKNVYTGILTDKGEPSWSKTALGEMKRNMSKIKDCMQHYKDITFIDGKLSKTGKGFILATMLTLYAKDYFDMKVTKNDLYVKGKNGEKMDKKLFWLTVKDMYLNEMKKVHILDLIQKNNSLNKALNSYVDKLTQVDNCVMHYRLKGTKSGRLSSGNGSKSEKSRNHYYIDLNAQNLTKPKSGYYKAEKCSKDDPESILGWKFTPLDDDYALSHLEEEYIVEGQDPNPTIRGCLKAPEGRYVVSLDYDAQEYKVACCLSGDTVSKDMFLRGIDPHTATAYAIWGEENYDKAKRKKAKVCIGNKTMLHTNHGLKHPCDLLSSDKLIDSDKKEQNWIMTKEFGELIEVTYNNGITEQYTPNHRLRIWDGKNIEWKQVKDLSENDTIVQRVGFNNTIQNTPLIEDFSFAYHGRNFKKGVKIFNIRSNAFAYLGGLYLGDGNMQFKRLKNGSKKVSSVIYCADVESSDKVIDLMDSCGISPSSRKSIGKNDKIQRLPINNIAWASCVLKYFGEGKNKCLASILLQEWNQDNLRHFIAGLLDSDGTVSKGRTSFTTTSSELAEAMVQACSIVGIKTTLKHRYCRLRGEPYHWIEIRLWDIRTNLPILNSFRKGFKGSRETQLGTWATSIECAKGFREKVRLAGNKYDSNIYETWDNVSSGRCGITQGVVNKTLTVLESFPIKEDMVPLKVTNKKRVIGDIFVIQTDSHTYCTLCSISHNCNFCIQYGGGAPTLSESLDIPLAEAEEIIAGYEKGFWQTVQWKRQEVDKMYANQGVVFNAFGRPRTFMGWLEIIDKTQNDYDNWLERQQNERTSMRIKAAVERRVPSHLIQGTCGDILRLVLYKLYKRYFKNRDPHIDFMSTVHDEINYTIDKDCTVEYVKELEKIMTFDVLDKTLPITTSTDIGFTYGNMFPFVWEDESKQVLIPKRVHHA